MIGLPILKVRPVESKQPRDHHLMDIPNSKAQFPNRKYRIWILESVLLLILTHGAFNASFRLSLSDVRTLVVFLFSLC